MEVEYLRGKAADVEAEEVKIRGTENTSIRWLVSREKGSRHIALRRFTMGKGGGIPLHRHGYEEAFYVLDGRLEVRVVPREGKERSFELGEGDFTYVAGGVPHSLRNVGDGDVDFICAIDYVDDMGIEVMEEGEGSARPRRGPRGGWLG